MNENEFSLQSKAMVELQIKGRGIIQPEILEALKKVPRHLFVPRELWFRAYEDKPLPIGYDQTISQPYIVAFMIDKIFRGNQQKVLEIGTGSGYQTAILSQLFQEVYSVELSEPLAMRANAVLLSEGYQNYKIIIANGYNGWKDYAPFDGIIVSCAPLNIPKTLIDQLAEGGKMIIPVGEPKSQKLYIIEKLKGKIIKTESLPVNFVPMLDNI